MIDRILTIRDIVEKKLKERGELTSFLCDYCSMFSSDYGYLDSVKDKQIQGTLGSYIKDGYALVSTYETQTKRYPNGGEINSEENESKAKALIEEVKATNFRFLPIYGVFIEEKEGEEDKVVYVKSLIILNHDKGKKVGDVSQLYQLTDDICNKYHSKVLYKDPDGDYMYINGHEKIYCDFLCDKNINTVIDRYLSGIYRDARNIPKKETDNFFGILYNNNADVIRNNWETYYLGAYVNPKPEKVWERYTRDHYGELFAGL